MRGALLLLCLVLGGCQPTFREVAFPEEPREDWIKSSPSGATGAYTAPDGEQVRTFGEETGDAAAIRVAVRTEDFYGSKLYDGFAFTLQPLDAGGRVVKKLGHLTVVVHVFEGDALTGKGAELLRWRVPASRTAELWQSGGVNRGYHMKLAWTERPVVDHVRMDVSFETLDGKTFGKLITPDSLDQPRYRWLKQ